MADLSINGVSYPLAPTRDHLGYTVLQAGEALVETIDGTWALGMGYTKKRGPFAGYLHSDGWDATDPNYLRLAPSRSSLTIDAAGALGNTYFFEDAHTGGTNYLYVMRADKAYKIRTSDFTLQSTFTFPATTALGQPALFEKEWHAACGGLVDFRSLTAIGLDAAADTWTAAATAAEMKVLHFATFQDKGVAKIAKAEQTNLVSLASTGPRVVANWSSPGLEAGDTSLAISALVGQEGLLRVVKPDNIYDFDGVSFRPILEGFVRHEGLATDLGVGSYAYGSLFFAPFQAGVLWRTFGQRKRPVGPDTIEQYGDVSNVTSIRLGRHREMAGLGAWLHTIYGNFWGAAFIEEDGISLRWHTFANLSNRGTYIASDGTLYTTTATALLKTSLAADGSTNTALESNRGTANANHDIFFYKFDHGLPNEQKQLTKIVTRTLSFPGGATASLQPRIHRDEGAAENVGSAITTSALSENVWTAGTNDLYYEAMLSDRLTTTAGYAPSTSDPRIMFQQVHSRSGSIVQYTLELTRARLTGITPTAALDNLRRLQSRQVVAVRQPGFDATHSVEIVDVRESLRGGGEGFDVVVIARRWDVP